MADLERLDELRDFVEQSDDPEIVRVRDRLQDGEEQPTFETRSSVLVVEGIVEVGVAESLVIPFELPLEFLEQLDSQETRAFVVVRVRSLTDNTFKLRLQLGPEAEFAAETEPDEQTLLQDMPFFDHADAEDHALGDLVEAESPLGHFFIEATTVLRQLRERGFEGGMAGLRVTPIQIHENVESDVGFMALGAVSLEIVDDLN